MTTARQILHFLRKDLRAHWSEIVSLVLLNVLLAVLCIQSSAGGATPVRSILEHLVEGVLIVAWCLSIARVVQADGPAGARQHWLTRPYSRLGLLAGKAAYALGVVHLPLLVTQIVIVSANGLPLPLSALLLNQIVIAVALTLPAILIAALTRNAGRFLFVAVIVGGVAAVLMQLVARVADVLGSPASRFGYPVWGAESHIAWPAEVIGLVLLGSISLAALVRQYIRRDTRRIAMIAGVAATAVGGIVLAFPPGLSSRARATLIGPPAEPLVLRFRDVSEGPGLTSYAAPMDGLVALPVDLSGVSRFDVASARISVELRTRSGIARTMPGILSGYSSVVDVPELWIQFLVPADFSARIRNEPVSARIVADMTIYGRRDLGPVPLDGSETLVDGRERCGLGAYSYFYCRGVFDRVSSMVSDWRTDGRPLLLTVDEFSLPLAINPVSTLGLGMSSRKPLPPSVAMRSREPAGYARLRLEIENIRLDEWRVEFRNFEAR